MASATGAGLVYSDYYDMRRGRSTPHPVTDYQLGSIRDDFNFGSVLLMDSTSGQDGRRRNRRAGRPVRRVYAPAAGAVAPGAAAACRPSSSTAKSSSDTRKSGEKQFDYVDPRNRAVQIEMETAATAHLRKDRRPYLRADI